MSNNSTPSAAEADDEMRAEYEIDYHKARSNRFAAHLQEGGRLIVLEPDVAAVFTTNEAVNTLLRALIHALPPQQSPTILSGSPTSTTKTVSG